MTDYTPTTEVIRHAVSYPRERLGEPRPIRPEAFDRWLDQTLREAKAEAWDEGHRTPQDREPDGCQCGAWYEGECACGLFGTGTIITPNPYRKEQDQ